MELNKKNYLLKKMEQGQFFTSTKELILIFKDSPFDLNHDTFINELDLWWNNIQQIFYPNNTFKIDERIINEQGEIFDKLDNQWIKYNINLDQIELEIITLFLLSTHGMELNFKIPFCSFTGFEKTTNNQYRFTFQITKKSPKIQRKIFIRCFHNQIPILQDWRISSELFKKISNSNCLISGATGSGKTTLLKSLLKPISNDQHIVVIEDLNEIGLITSNTTQLCSADLNLEMNQLLANALRMAPDRIILGEIRSIEVVPYLMALNLGVKGSLATIHGNSARDAIYRLAQLVQFFGDFEKNNSSQILKLISKNIDYVLYLKNKKIVEIIELKGASETGTLFFEDLLSL